jgi:GNAT superfamily N-acetyltransferase
MIGVYHADNPTVGANLLRKTAELLVAHGAARVLGPMDGGTWGRYRIPIQTEPTLPRPLGERFAGEPDYPEKYHADFVGAGFAAAADYETRIDISPGTPRPLAAALARRLEQAGIRFTQFPVDPSHEQLHEAFQLCERAFSENLFYSPCSLELFIDQFEALRPRLESKLLQAAVSNRGDLIGFLLAYPDPPHSAPARARLIAKTVAVDPGFQRLGLGMHLLDRISAVAAEAGFPVVIHALMEQANTSLRHSLRRGTAPLRRYLLYQYRPPNSP